MRLTISVNAVVFSCCLPRHCHMRRLQSPAATSAALLYLRRTGKNRRFSERNGLVPSAIAMMFTIISKMPYAVNAPLHPRQPWYRSWGGLDGADLNCYIKQTFKARWRKETAMDETKEKILAAATRLFARRGLDGVTIREICREAGVNGALVNYHFGTKENLYGACMRRMFESGGGPTVVALDRDVKDARSWKAAVRAWVHGFSDTMHDVRGTTGFAAGAFRHEVVNPSALSGHILEAYGRPLFESLCRLLRMATRTEMEVRLWATAIWSQLSSYALVDPMWQEPFRPEGVTREAWGAAFADFICARVFRELKYRGAPA